MNERDLPLTPFSSFTWEKTTIWLGFIGLLYALRSFFSTIFLTYIMSWVALRLVGALTGRPGGTTAHWSRQPVVILVYVFALALSYMACQSLIPRAIEQGKTLLSDVSRINLEKIREDILARTVGHVEFSGYRRSDRYEMELEEFIRDKCNILTYREATDRAKQIRQAFEEYSVLQESQKAQAQLRRSGEFDGLYKQWLRAGKAETELSTNAELKQKLSERYDDSYRLIQGEAIYLQEKDTPAYKEKRLRINVEKATDQLFVAGQYRDVAEAEISGKRGKDAYRAWPDGVREAQFKEFFAGEVPKRFRGFGYAYGEFRVLEGVRDDADFRRKLPEKSSREVAVERFQDWTERRLAKEHPLSSLLGDTSELVRSWFPKVTGWLTTAINEILNFGFTALISLALSLMIVWEIPRLKAGLERVRGTRAEWILDEIAPEVVRLGTVIGVAFTAQFVIASVDASLAFVALTYLKLPSPVFLSLLVLVACLVPYVGVLIAALPILIVALQQGGVSLGLNTAFWLFMIHELEAWILSPKIMSGFLKLSPMMVVLVLCVAEPLFGLWGLILGVPVAVFLINDVLLKPLPGRTGSGPEAGGSPASD